MKPIAFFAGDLFYSNKASLIYQVGLQKGFQIGDVTVYL